MRWRLEHPIAAGADTYWRTFFDPEFNRRLYLEGLGFSDMLVERQEESDEGVERRIRVTPKLEIPRALRKVLGESLSYVEEGHFERRTGRWSYRVIPSRMADRIRIDGAIWVQPEGEGRVRRISEVEVIVDVFGVGGAVERFLGGSLEENYERSAEFTNRYLAE